MARTLAPGTVRDAIKSVMTTSPTSDLSVAEIHERVCAEVGEDVPASSVRSSLRLNAERYEQPRRGYYRLARRG